MKRGVGGGGFVIVNGDQSHTIGAARARRALEICGDELADTELVVHTCAKDPGHEGAHWCPHPRHEGDVEWPR
jgi:hypothetical protein